MSSKRRSRSFIMNAQPALGSCELIRTITPGTVDRRRPFLPWGPNLGVNKPKWQKRNHTTNELQKIEIFLNLLL